MHSRVRQCAWKLVGPSQKMDGFKRYACIRTGCDLFADSPYDPDRIINPENNPCRGLPMAHEWRDWIMLFADAYGLTYAAAICRYVLWRAKGSPLSELPPGIPKPDLPPPNFGLTDSEVSELFPGEDHTLLGNRIKSLTEAVGIPMCGRCDKRRQWLNAAHEWLRSRLASRRDA